MFKGINRKAVVRTEKGSPLEAVYAVLRQGVRMPEKDIVREAERIASRGISKGDRWKGRVRLPLWCAFGIGVLSGAVITLGGALLLLAVS